MARVKRMKTELCIYRWSLLTAGLIACFWAIWYFIAGQVPVVNEIKMSKNLILELPFGISRWWDILIGPIWSTIFILIFTNEKIRENVRINARLTAGLVGLVAGLGAGLLFGLLFGLVAVLSLGLLFGLDYLSSKRFWQIARNWLLVK